MASLGALTWFQVPKVVKVSVEGLDEALTKAGFEQYVPSHRAKTDAVRLMIKEVMSRFNAQEDEEGNTVALVFTSAPPTDEDHSAMWRVFQQVKTAKGRQVSYEQVATMTCDLQGNIDVTLDVDPDEGTLLDNMLSFVIEKADDIVKDLCDNYDASQIRRCIGNVMTEIRTMKVKPSVNFVAKSSQATLNKIQETFSKMDEGRVSFSIITIEDSAENKEQIASDYNATVEESLSAIEEKLLEASLEGSKISKYDLRNMLLEIDEFKVTMKEFGILLDGKIAKPKNMAGLRKQVEAILEEVS